MKKIVIFADGSSLGNPGPGGWGAIVSMGDRVRELGGRAPHTTNNKMELTAAIEALRIVVQDQATTGSYELVLNTDSSYVINGITKWIHGWQKNQWKTSTKEPVLNRELWEELLTLTRKIHVTWKYVKGHAGISGNERVDEIATSFSSGTPADLYDGTLDGYEVNLDTPATSSSVTKKKKSSPKGVVFSYLSLVNGKLLEHRTWAECESRVKGTRGAKFKKAMNESDVREIKKSWGL